MPLKNGLVLLCHYRFELVDIAHQEQLLATERLASVAAEGTQYTVHEIEHVGAHHRDFIYHHKFHLAEHLDVASVQVQPFAEPRRREACVVGHKRLQRKVKERMQSLSAHVHRRHSRGCEHHTFLGSAGNYVAEEGGLAGPGTPGEKHRCIGLLDHAPERLILGIGLVNLVHRG